MAIKNPKQAGRFLVVGGTATVIDFGLLFLLRFLGIPTLASNIISTGIAFVFSFFANKKYAFKSSSGNLRREMILFTLVTLFGLWVIQSAIIWLLTPPLMSFGIDEKLSLLLAKVFATGVTMVWNYVLYAKVVFTHPTARNHPESE